MSQNSNTGRQLSLTEELEKLEQSITLTLQEIDHNFSRAHRIVTSSILPIVEQYAEHSNAVWEGSKFWKQFFEASANVSLSGVEEREEEEDFGYSQTNENTSAYGGSVSQPGDEPSRHKDGYDETDDSLLDNADISGSTPRAPRARSDSELKPEFAEYSSPYEALKQELKGKAKHQDSTPNFPATPGMRSKIPDMSMTPTSSPFEPTTYIQSSRKADVDPLLHRILDKNYRIQATPHTSARQSKTSSYKPSWRDSDSPMSSPPVVAPQLRSEFFDSPIRRQYSQTAGPRTPGVSVQTPARASGRVNDTKTHKKDEISWESDSDEDPEGVYKELGMSPPKTIQFSLPQSRILQTPAREASKRIVEDLLTMAGADFDDSLENSPSVVGAKANLEDSF